MSIATHTEPLPSTAGPDRNRRMLPPAGQILAVAAGGMIGAMLRVGLVVVFPVHAGRFPWTTFMENVFGAFLLGLVLTLLLARARPGRYAQPFLCTGILGSFTTFSNFSLEMVELAGTGGQPALAMLYATGSVAAGLVAAVGGMALGRSGMRAVGLTQPSTTTVEAEVKQERAG